MKLSKIAAICNKTKHIALFTQDDEEKTQWAGDGSAAYALLGMPKFTADTIMNTFGVEESKKDVWLIDDVPLPEKFDVSVYRNSDVSGMIDLDSYVTYLGNSYIPVLVTDRRYYINKKYLDPIKFTEETQLIARSTDGRIYFLITDGMFPIALIMPVNIEENMRNWLKGL